MCRQNMVILSLNSKFQVYIFLTKIIVESVVQKVRNLTYKTIYLFKMITDILTKQEDGIVVIMEIDCVTCECMER
jgi:hypothetical protein